MFEMMASMMAMSNRMMADMEHSMMPMMIGMGGGEDDDFGPGNGALMDLSRMGGMGGGSSMMMMMGGGGGGSGFMMSSVQSFDPHNPENNYERTQTAQFGPNSVMEGREQVRDGRRGIEKIGLRRQLGDQYAQLERSRHLATGEERSKRTVHNVDDDDADRFDERWMAAAAQSLPTYRNGRGDGTQHVLPSLTRGALPEPPLQITAPPEPAPRHSHVRSQAAQESLPSRHSYARSSVARPESAARSSHSRHSAAPLPPPVEYAAVPQSYYRPAAAEYSGIAAPRQYPSTVTPAAYVPASYQRVTPTPATYARSYDQPASYRYPTDSRYHATYA